jgi:hypothetical protein
MPRILALTQFLIVALGAPVLHLLTRVQPTYGQSGAPDSPVQFLARHVLWLFAVPILYAAIGTALQGRVPDKALRVAGIALCALLLLLVGIPIVSYLA